jgi:hypothetical protein
MNARVLTLLLLAAGLLAGAGCATTAKKPYAPPNLEPGTPSAGKAIVYLIMWRAPAVKYSSGQPFTVYRDNIALAELNNATYFRFECDPGELRLSLKMGSSGALGGLAMGTLIGGPLTGLLTAGTMAVLGAADRSAMEKKHSDTALRVVAGQTYFLELEPLPREAAAVYQLSLLDLAEAEQRIAQCTPAKAAAAKAPPAPAQT